MPGAGALRARDPPRGGYAKIKRMARQRPSSRSDSRHAAASPARPRAKATPAPAPLGPLPYALAALVAAACVLVSASFRLYDTDAWQHLAVGRALWALHAVPTTEVWTWGNAGAPNVNPSWGFSALLWPFWKLGGVAGLWAWRWLTMLGAFALAGAAARRLGARGLAPLFALVICALVYRQRMQIRPETLAGVWLALTQWLLASRALGRGRVVALVAVALVWANTHVSLYLFFLLIGIHLAAAYGDRESAGERRDLWIALLAGAGVTLVNPFGYHAIVRPFEFLLRWRNEPMFRSIDEIGPLVWSQNFANGLPLLLLGWPLLLLWRWRQRRFDLAEWLLAAVLTLLSFGGNRFVATYSLAAAPWIARDLGEWFAAWRWPAPAPWPRAALVSIACVAACAWDWTHAVGPLGWGFDMSRAPVAACDFMQKHDVHGRGFNRFAYGGYMLWRFWPDSTRKPFMDIHPEDSTPHLRDLYHRATTTSGGWSDLVRELAPDYALLARRDSDRPNMLDTVDADSTWALVFVDDVAALYVRRSGVLAPLAATRGYATLGGSRRSADARIDRALADPAWRERMRAELARQAAESPVNFYGRSMLRALDGPGQ